MQTTDKNNAGCMKIAGIAVAGCVFTCIVIAIMISLMSQSTPASKASYPSATDQVATIFARRTADAAASVPEATKSPQGKLTSFSADVFSNRLISAQMDGITATLVVSAAKAMDESGMVRFILDDLRHITPRIFAETNVQWFTLHIQAGFTDIYGNDVIRDAAQLDISRSVNNKINWPNYNACHLADLPFTDGMNNGLIVHPALQKAWDAYCSSR
jgi:hypothetical protein